MGSWSPRAPPNYPPYLAIVAPNEEVGMSVRFARTLVSLASALVTSAGIAEAQLPVTWTQGVSGNWNQTASWTGLQGGDLFPQNGARSYTVTIGASAGQVGLTSVVFDQSTGAVGNLITLSGLNLTPVLNAAGTPAAELVLGPGTQLNAGTLANFSGSTLSGGRYFIDGTLRFNGANIQTLASGTTLVFNGAAASILNQANNANALTNFSVNQGEFDIRNGFNHSTVAGFQNSGVVSVSEGSTFAFGANSVNTGLALASGVSGIGTVSLNGGTFTNTGGNLIAGNQGVVVISGANLIGGTVSTNGSGRLVATNDGNNFASGVTLNGTLDLATNVGILRTQNGLTLNGTASINSNSILAFQGTQTLGGTGTVVFGNTGSSNRFTIDASNSVVTIGSGVQLRGQNGTIGAQTFISSASTTLVNNGRISADVSGGVLTFQQAAVTNNTIVEGLNGGTIQINTAFSNGSGGQLNAANNGVALLNGVTLTGGTINTTTGGRFVATNNGNNFVNDVTLNGVADLATATGIVRVNGSTGLTLGAGSVFNINSNSVLAFQGAQTLGGSGAIVFGGTGASNRVAIDGTGSQLTIGANAKIRGENGTIGTQAFIGSSSTTLVNNGRISADVNGGTITIAQATVTNNGVLEALNGGRLVLSSDVVGTANGQILAGAGSTVLQNGVVLSGTINTSGSGTFTASNNGNNYLSGVTLNGNMDLASATGNNRVLGGMVLNGTVGINSNSALAFQGTQSLTGNGFLLFGNTGSSNQLAIDGSGTALTIGSGIVVHGENGTVGAQRFVASGSTSLINNGRISADVAGGTITIAQATVTNNGTLEARNGGRLLLSSDVAGTANGQILAGAGSTVLQNGVTLSGIINTSGSGTFTATNSGNNFLNAVTLNGNLDLATATANNRALGGMVLNGTVGINSNSALAFQGSQSLTGNGSILFGNTGSSNQLAIDGTGTSLTVSSGIVIHGENGTVGAQRFLGSGSTALINNGRISADVAGGVIDLSQATFQNNNILEAKNSGTLRMNSAINNSATGQINASSNGVALLNGTTITGGTINTSGGGRFVATNTGNNFLNDATIAGTVDIASATGVIRVNGATGLAMQSGGVININSNSVLAFQGTQALSGTGEILFGNTGSSNQIAIDGSGSQLTIGSGILVHGINGTVGPQRFIGSAGTVLINNGTINSDGGGLITVAGSPVGSFTNNGTLRAQNGSLNLALPVTGTGTLRVDAAGVLNMSSLGASTQNRLEIGNIGAALNTANQNITINADYTNGGSGVGNAFNNRAGIGGTGLILAGGNAAQAITGANITNGATTNATLTIGNVRVGSNTFGYQIANTGTTGPDLRGAVQTSVNGGNIIDARLSGSGVTASNYGPIATQSNSGNLNVVFNAASAGVIAPLAAQAVNLRSNFANIADQKLNIVVGSGAAAYNAAVGSASPSPTNLGNTRIGGTLAGTLTVANTAAAGPFSEKLDATFGVSAGQASNNGGTISLLAAGSSNTSSMGVALSTGAAGARTGTVTLDYATNGTGTSGLATASAGSQVVTVNGNVFQAAVGNLSNSPYNFGTVQVGQSVSQNLNISNAATGPAGFVEDLNASFGATSGQGASQISGSGSINGLTAGASNSNGMLVTVNTNTAGTINGAIGVNFFSAGAVNGVSNGLGSLAVGSASFGVNGTINAVANVINAANPVVNNAPINLGNVRLNSASPTAFVSLTNQTTAAPQAALNATIAGNGQINASGSFTLLNPGATNTSSLQVSMNTATAGLKNGMATIGLVSDATNVGNCGSSCQMALPSQNVAVNGAVYRMANPTLNTASVTLVARRGDAGPTANVSVTNSSPDIYTERLDASFGSTPSGFTTSGAISGLVAGASTNALSIALTTGTAGAFGGSAAIDYISSGAGTTGAADASVGTGIVNVIGKVYETAVGQVNTTTVNFGIVHVGDVVGPFGVSVSNGAAVTALNDMLVGNISTNSPMFSANGTLGTGVAAGATNASSLSVGLNTSTAGVYSGSASVTLASRNGDMADLALGSTSIVLQGQVNHYAKSAFAKTSGFGLFTQVLGGFTLDFGTVLQGTSGLLAGLGIANTANGPSDLLGGDFSVGLASAFMLSGLGAFTGIDAGLLYGGIGIGFNTNTLGAFSQVITLHSFGYNASGYNAALADVQLTVNGFVTSAPVEIVPEPSTLALMIAGLAALAGAQRRTRGRR